VSAALLAVAVLVQGPALDVTATVDRARLTVGEQLVLTIQVRAQATELPRVELPTLSGFAVLGSREATEVSLEGSDGTTRAIVRARGADQGATSPTFALTHRYLTPRGPVFHVDCYRFKGEEEASALDWSELISGDLLIVEWPDRGGSWVPPATHRLRLGHLEDPDLREVAIHADLAPTNMLVCGTRIVVLDFAMAARGSYLHDISRLFLQLDVLRAKPRYRPHVIDALQAALLRGLDPALTAGHPLFRYLLMLHRINHLGTLALRRERFPASVLSARVGRLHRQWIERELAASEVSS